MTQQTADPRTKNQEKENNDNSEDRTSSDVVKDVSTKPSLNNGHIAVFQNRYYIDLQNELSQYTTGELKAYQTGENKSKPSGFFTVICHPHYISRTNVTKSYAEVGHSGVPNLVASGRAIMPDGTAKYCYIYRDNLGEKLYDKDTEIALGWKSERVMESVVLPIILCLKDLQQRDVTHGNIRMSNLYKVSGETKEKVMLGECLSVPASFHQPTIYEPIERAMADPIGRGEGTIKDDLYALGVVMAMHMRNFDPLRGKSDAEVISSKVVNGSYGALIGSTDRISSGVSDLLRGLLTDNEKLRWSLEDVFDWFEGRRNNVNQSIKAKKAARGIEFDGTKFFYAKTFASRLLLNHQEAMRVIDNNELTHWIERSLSDPEMLERVNNAVSSAKENGIGIGYADRLLPRISIAMDPIAPIRYRSLSIHMRALGNSLGEAFQKKKGLANFTELFNNGILYFWISVTADLNMDVTGYMQQFEKVKGFLRQKDITGGIERCLYYLNSSIHCLSPVVSDYFVTTPKDYILALERVAEKHNGKYPDKIIDKHTACFIISKDTRLIEPYVFDLSSDHSYRYISANLKVLSDLQRFNNLPSLPYLTEWVCGLLDPLIERYHDTEQQKKIKTAVNKKKDNGYLPDILKVVDNIEKVKRDQVGFKRAVGKYRDLQNELHALGQKLENPKYFSEKVGREWAATVSGVVSALIILGFLLVNQWNSPGI